MNKFAVANLFDVLNALFDGSYLVNEIDFSIYVRKTSKNKSNVSSILFASGIIMYFFCTVAPHCYWLSYQRDLGILPR